MFFDNRTTIAAQAACAVALVLACFVGGAAAQSGDTRIGIYFNRDASITVGKALGVAYERYHMPISPPNSAAMAKIRAAEAAGFKVNVTFNNMVKAGARTHGSGPVTNDVAFEAALAADLDATHPDLVTIQNEEDGQEFSAGTPAQYLHELSAAVRTAHAKGYKVTNGGLTSMGVKLAFWRHLWARGDHAGADAFATMTLSPAEAKGKMILADIPNSRDPNRAVLSASPMLLEKLRRAEALIAGYRQTGIDYVNFHWYESDAANMGQVAVWLAQTVGRPAISNEMGQYNTDGAKVAQLLGEAERLHMPYVFWFANDGHGPAVGLADESGALRANGAAFEAFVADHR